MLSFYLSLADTPEDKDKIRGIYEKYHDLMMAVAVRFFDDRHDAEDAVHQAFLTIIKNLEKISRVDCPETRRFCVIITRSRCLDRGCIIWIELFAVLYTSSTLKRCVLLKFSPDIE